MKRLAATVCLMALGSLAAEARPMTSTMSCATAQQIVARAGAIVINFTPTTYDRVVSHQGYCLPSEVIDPLWAPTRDARACFIGYACKEGESWRW